MEKLIIGKKVRLQESFALQQVDRVRKVCACLIEQYPITGFRYTKIYKNNQRIIFSDHAELLCYFYEEGLYPNTWFDGHTIDLLKAGWSYWKINESVIASPQQVLLSAELAQYFNFSEGVSLTAKQQDYIEVYEFLSDSPVIYTVLQPVLTNFIYFF